MVASHQSPHHIIFTKSEPWTRLSKWFGHCDNITVILQNGLKNCTTKLYLWKQVLQTVEPVCARYFIKPRSFWPNLGLRLWLLLTPHTNQAWRLTQWAAGDKVTDCKNRHKTPRPVTTNSLGPLAQPGYRISSS